MKDLGDGLHLDITSPFTGAADYTKLFIEHHFDFIDVLAAFPTFTAVSARYIGGHLCTHILCYSASQKKWNDCHVCKNGAKKRREKVAHKSFTGEFCDSLAFVYDRPVSLTENLQLLGLQNLTAMPSRSKLKRSKIWTL